MNSSLPILLTALLSIVSFAEHRAVAAAEWKDVSSPLLARLTNNGAKAAWPGGCSGVVANRTNGEVTIKVVGLGLWRSVDLGRNWTRIDGDTISGRDETGWATSVDPENPSRMASFSLDGTAGWTPDGVRWRRFGNMGRNWDYGSVDWGSAEPRTIFAAKHETSPPGEVYVSKDGGVTWNQVAVHLLADRNKISMVGVLNENTLIYGKGDGIHRSTDFGRSWTRVSDANPQTRIPVRFGGAHYLGDTNGLLRSRDRGMTWERLGTAVDVWQGPLFGRDAREMVVVGRQGVFRTRDGAATWQRVAGLPGAAGAEAGLPPRRGGFVFEPNWFGCFAWDPVNNLLYASAMGNPVYQLAL